MAEHDSIHAFNFIDFPVRGKLVHLDASWQAVLNRKNYPERLKSLLGEALAAAVLLSSTLKFDGRLTLQLHSDGPISLLLSQCSSNRHVRGLAHWDDDFDLKVPVQTELLDLLRGGRLAINIESNTDNTRYQGIVPLEASTLAKCVEAYFAASEQLPTRLWMASDGQKVVGMLLQQMPREGGRSSGEQDPDAWPRVQLLADTITNEELLALSDREILRRLFHEEDVRLYESSPVSFNCSCSWERIHTMLNGLGKAEVDSIIKEQGRITVDCEFCGKSYQLDRVDAEQLFLDTGFGASVKKH